MSLSSSSRSKPQSSAQQWGSQRRASRGRLQPTVFWRMTPEKPITTAGEGIDPLGQPGGRWRT
jgi:hypothetical protein